MHRLLPSAAPPRLTYSRKAAAKQAIDTLDHLLIVLPAKPAAADWKAVPDGSRLRRLLQASVADIIVRSRLNNARSTGVTIVRLPAKQSSSFALQKQAGEAIRAALEEQPRRLGLLLSGLDDDRVQQVGDALVLAILAASFQLPYFGAQPLKRRRLQTIRLLGLPAEVKFDAMAQAAAAQNLARWLTALPASHLTASTYQELLKELAKEEGWQYEFYGEKRLEKLGAGAFLAVAQGNSTRDAGIVRLRYRPTREDAPAVALIGKGILFDTGGNNIKGHKSMLDMHEDMAGSATALAALLALSEQAYPGPIDCWLAITENRVSAQAYRPRDVVTASNGTTIEIIHTDAEGRMVLADTLALAGQESPDIMIDYATLTGACIYALTERYSGAFTNRPQTHSFIIAAGERSGERVWPFPLDEDYDEDIKSTAADVLQCSTDGAGDHILAARFLKRFVPEQSAWIHLDLSAANRKKGLGHIPGGVTGFGVRLTLELLRDNGRGLQDALV